MNKLSEYLKTLIRLAVPGRYNSLSFIVDSDHPLTPSIGTSYSLEVMEDVAGLTVVDSSLLDTGGSYPTDITAGYITFGTFKEVSVTGGIIKAYLV